MQRTGFWVLLTLMLFATVLPTGAQDGNLLKDGGFEGQYTNRGRADFNVPADWGVWFAESPRTEVWMNLQPVMFPHNGPDPSPQQGSRAVNINKGFATFTAAIYQQVAVAQGANVRGSAHGYLHTCNIPDNAEKCGSAVEAGSYLRVGIDPNGGTNPLDSDIVWSGNVSPHDRWQEIAVDATATGTTVTLFLYGSQAFPSELNNTYWDNASLTVGGGGGAAPGAAPAATPIPTAPPFVPFVSRQGEREDGSIVHRVQAGDTVDSIAVAYGVTRQDIMTLNNLIDPRIIQVGQELIIQPPSEAAEAEPEATESAAPVEATETVTEAEPEVTTEAAEPAANTQAEATEAAAEPSPEPTEAENTEPENTEPEEQAAPQSQSSGLLPDQAPPAPVISVASGNVLPAINPAETTSAVCVTLFEDANQNRIQEEGEPLLAGGTITLLSDGNPANEHQTDGVSQPHCFSELGAGDYVASAAVPDGYGLTTPDQLHVVANAGATVNVVFGAAPGIQPIQPPPPESGELIEEVVEPAAAARPANPIMDNLGLIMFGAAGVVLVVGMGATLLLRRR